MLAIKPSTSPTPTPSRRSSRVSWAGKLADIITIDLAAPHFTPLTSPAYQLVHFANGADVDTVIVAGRVVKRGARLVHLDADAIRADARLESDRAFARAGEGAVEAYRWR